MNFEGGRDNSSLHANIARQVHDGLLRGDYALLGVYLPDEVLEKLEEDFAFAFWSKVDGDHTAVRVCTSWATEERAVKELIRALDRCTGD